MRRDPVLQGGIDGIVCAIVLTVLALIVVAVMSGCDHNPRGAEVARQVCGEGQVAHYEEFGSDGGPEVDCKP